MQEAPVIIVGAGLAGLRCAVVLHERGVQVRVLEASDREGGVLRTQECDGFRLDRGFQVLQTAYPEARACLDYAALDLRPFEPGARIRLGGRWRRVSDPFRRPTRALETLTAGIASPADGLRLARLRRRVRRSDLETLLTAADTSTLVKLRQLGFSEHMIAAFFRPFYRGVFLEPELETSSRLFEFTFRMFATGDVCLPAGGMQAIPRQLAARLPPGSVRCATAVERIGSDGVVLAGGERVEASQVVVATGARAARRLVPGLPETPHRSVCCLYFDAARPPLRGPSLLLNADEDGPVSHLCVPSEVAPELAPTGRSLVSVSVLGLPTSDDSTLEAAVRAQLSGWFSGVESWRLLRVDRIEDALPVQTPERMQPVTKPVRLGDRVLVCGGHRETASIGGALRSGRRAAEAVLGARQSTVCATTAG